MLSSSLAVLSVQQGSFSVLRSTTIKTITILSRTWLLFTVTALLSVLIPLPVIAAESTNSIQDADIENNQRVISIDKNTSDKAIKKRLEDILKSAKKYSNISIQVDEGLVFIDGQVENNNDVQWAADIAGNVQGVIGVANNLVVKDVDYFSYKIIEQQIFKLWKSFLLALPSIVVGIFVLGIFYLVSRPLSRWLGRPINYLTQSQLIRNVVHRVISILVILLGLYFFLRITGLTQFAVAIISGTGVLGLILGFAFRDIAENFMSSLLLSVQRPFRLGDLISVDGRQGMVQKVTARGTTLVDFDGNHIQIPNATIYKNTIQNFSANPNMRGSFIIGIGYDASIKNAQLIARELINQQQVVLKDPEPQVLVDNLGSATVVLRIYFWIDSREHALNKVASLLMRLITREFEANNISMPDDAREIVFPQGVPVKMLDSQQNNSKTQSSNADAELKDKKVSDRNIDMNAANEDLSSDKEDIQKQADQAREPEEGKNIL